MAMETESTSLRRPDASSILVMYLWSGL
uniref:Uncharacterized protein n=1 Tax=Solanum lycopersicum TaxID=4081 RepID=A0A3Q7FB04_SOLLC